MKTESILWLLPVVFMIHDFEEIVMMKPWAARNVGGLQRRFPRLASRLVPAIGRLSTGGFAVAVAEEFLLLSALTLLAVEYNLFALWTGLLLAFFVHLLVHVGQFLVFRRYVPVIFTSLPAAVYCVVAARELTAKGLVDWGTAVLWGIGCLALVGLNLFLALQLGARFDSWASRWQASSGD